MAENAAALLAPIVVPAEVARLTAELQMAQMTLDLRQTQAGA